MLNPIPGGSLNIPLRVVMQFCITLHFSTTNRARIVKLGHSMHKDDLHRNQLLILIWVRYDLIICINKPNFVRNKVQLRIDFECQYLLKKIVMIMISESYDKGLLVNRWFENTSWNGKIGKFWSIIGKIGISSWGVKKNFNISVP